MKFTYRVTLEVGYMVMQFDFDSKSDAIGFAEDAKKNYLQLETPLRATIEPLIRDEDNTDN